MIAESGSILSANGGSGRGGNVIIWSDGDTNFAGSLNATGSTGGGFAEVSGKHGLIIDDAVFELGSGGTLLLDPSNFTITDTVRNAILPTLNGGTDVVIYTNGTDPGVGNGDIIVGSDFSAANTIAGNGSLSLMAWGDIVVSRDLISNGSGNINLVAGWNGATPVSFGPPGQGSNVTGTPKVNMADIFADTSTYGNRQGSIYVGLETDKTTLAQQGIVIGSRAGGTNMAGYNLVMKSGNNTASSSYRMSQIGYRAMEANATGRGVATGSIRVEMRHDVTMTASDKPATDGSNASATGVGYVHYVKIGHGGYGSSTSFDNAYNLSGSIIVRAGGDIIGTAGNNLGNFVQIGHGGYGGGTAAGSFSGDIKVEASGKVEFTAGQGRRAFALIGHGGDDVDGGINGLDNKPGEFGVGYHSGEITVKAGADVKLTGGIGYTGGSTGNIFVSDSRAFAMIGHGGASSEARGTTKGHNGNISVQAGTGMTSGAVFLKAGDLDDNFAQIGHGGRSSGVTEASADGHQGNITVKALTGITLLGGTGQTFRGTADGQMYAQIGHGGYTAGVADNVNRGHHGNISVFTSRGDIKIYGGDTTADADGIKSAGNGLGRIHYAQIGHGGYSTPGSHWGSITVESGQGNVIGKAGNSSDNATDGSRNWALIGHGGYISRGSFGKDYQATDEDGSLIFDGAGEPVMKREVISVTAGGSITFTGGPESTASARNFAQIGHGGYDSALSPQPAADGSGNSADIIVLAKTGDIIFQGGSGQYGFAQLGHGGYAMGGKQSGDITVTATQGNIQFLGGSNTYSWALLGHGGYSGDSDIEGNIEVKAENGAITFKAGSGVQTFVQLGHGGYIKPGNRSGAITVTTKNELLFQGGTATHTFAHLGHGGTIGSTSTVPTLTELTTKNGNNSGVISVTSTDGGITFAWGAPKDSANIDVGNLSYAQLGHGGRVSIGDHDGSITVSAKGDILFRSVTGSTTSRYDNYVQLGHGGIYSAGNHSGKIQVTSENGTLSFRGGARGGATGGQRYAQLGHGGLGATGSHRGDIEVTANGNITFTALSTVHAVNSYMQLGHGGMNAPSPNGNSGDIRVISETGAITFTATANSTSAAASNLNSYAQLGHGGIGSTGDHEGDIFVVAGTNIVFTGGAGSHATYFVEKGYAQLGHGGWGASASDKLSGDIAVYARTGYINFTAGTGRSVDSYAQLGHGGIGASGDHTGDIVARAGNYIFLNASTGTDRYDTVDPSIRIANRGYAQIGHGGLGSEGDREGDIIVTARIAGAFAEVDLNGDGIVDENDEVTITEGTSSEGIRLYSGTNATADAASDAYTQIGHGGRLARGTNTGDIYVESVKQIRAVAGYLGARTYSQLGHGGSDSGPIGAGPGTLVNDGSIDVISRDDNIDFRWAATSTLTSSGTYAQLGHGGYLTDPTINGINAGGDSTGAIRVSAGSSITFQGAKGGLNPDGTASEGNYVQLGHGGVRWAGDHSGNIVVVANAAITFTAGNSTDGSRLAYAQLGHGGWGVQTSTGLGGDIAVYSKTSNISFNAGTGNALDAYAQLGHGGIGASGDHTGDIVVRAGSYIFLNASTGTDRYDTVDPSIRIANRGYAQIGHGGLGSEGDREGDIIVTARIAGAFAEVDLNGDGIVDENDEVTITEGTSSEGIRLYSGTNATADAASDAYTQIGHGGRLARGTNTGDIYVESVKQIRAVAGYLGARTYSQLGHGGSDSAPIGAGPGTLVNNGSIDVISRDNNIDFRWAATSTLTSDGTYAQLGHGGYLTDPTINGINAGGDSTGAIRVSAGSNLLFQSTTGGVTASGTVSEGNYVQLGHGGLRWTGDHSGSISVRAGASAAGTIQFLAGDGASGHESATSAGAANRYAHLGHGGAFARGSHSGDIDVLSAGNITFTAGRNPQSYAQLGHGGLDADDPDGSGRGNSGEIRVTSTNGNLTFNFSSTSTSATGTPGLKSYAQLGHGGFETTGSNQGNIFVHVGGDILFRGSRGNDPANHTGNYVQLGHGGYSAEGNHSGSITVSAGIADIYEKMFDTDGDGVRDDVAVTTNGNGSITFLSGAGYTHRYAQLGHGGALARGDHGLVGADGKASETISVTSKGDIVFTSQGTTYNYVQLGNGGNDADPVTNPRGAAANIEVISEAGSIQFSGSTSSGTGAQIGNGGYSNSGSHRGNIYVTAGKDVLFTAAQSLTGTTGNGDVMIGNGGRSAVGDHSGNITVKAGTSDTTGSIRFVAGRAEYRYAQLGHGGRAATGNHSGDIIVEAAGDIEFKGGDFRQITLSNTTGAQVASAAINGTSGKITTTAASQAYINPGSVSITLTNPTDPKYGEIKDDGLGNLVDQNNQKVGTINYANGDVTFTQQIANAGATAGGTFQEGNFTRSYAQLGHGGAEMTTTRGHSGDIQVVAGLGGVTGDILFSAGVGNYSYTQLGHGGHGDRGDHTGDIWVDALGKIEFKGNQGMYDYAQLGHGGYDADLNVVIAGPDGYDSNAVGNTGDIFVNRGSELKPGTQTPRRTPSFGVMPTTSGNIVFAAGTGKEAYTQLGHGGYGTRGASSGNVSKDASGNPLGENVISVRTDGDLTFTSGDGSGFGNDTALQTGNGRRAYAQLGHGGYDADGSNSTEVDGQGHSADIRVDAGGKVSFIAADIVKSRAAGATGPIANDFRSYVQLGHGGYASSGDHRGSITVTAGTGLEFHAGGVAAGSTTNLTQRNYAQLGHGGYEASGYILGTRASSGDIEVTVTTGDLIFSTGLSTYAPAQLGHGGYNASGDYFGNITVDVKAGKIKFDAGSGERSFAQLGNGGFYARGDHSGEIQVKALNDIVFTGGAGSYSYAQIGHGGYDADNPNPGYYPDNDPLNPDRGPTDSERKGSSGDIAVESIDGHILFTAGTANYTYIQIGHGGALTDGDNSGKITVKAGVDPSSSKGGNITFLADGAGTGHYGQIGHGGYYASGGHTGDIDVQASGKLIFTAGGSGDYVQIGHGGQNSHRLVRGGSSNAYTRSNDNDRYYPGTHSGTIGVKSGGNILFTAGTSTGAYGQIGHGGYMNDAETGEGHSGAITVESAGNIQFLAQEGTIAQQATQTGNRNIGAYVQIGHGGFESMGNHGYEVVRSESGYDAVAQAGSGTLANGQVAPGSVRFTVRSGAGAVEYRDDSRGKLIGGGVVVGTIDYETGAIQFTTDVNPSGDAVEVAYLHGGSDILVDSAAKLVFQGGASSSYAQIGHGGSRASFVPTRALYPELGSPGDSNSGTELYHLNTPLADPVGTSGNVTVLVGRGANPSAGSNLIFTAGPGTDAYAQIGNGGRLARGAHRGDVKVEASGNIRMNAYAGAAGVQTNTSATLDARLIDPASGTYYTISRTANLELGAGFTIEYQNPLPGFSGRIVGDGAGKLYDNGIEVGTFGTNGRITMTQAVSSGSPAAVVTYNHYDSGLNAYAQIGHGGLDSDVSNTAAAGDRGNVGDITVRSTGGSITFTAGSRSNAYAQIGHGASSTNGDQSGNILVEAMGSSSKVSFTGGTNSNTYAQIGHGGVTTRGNLSGDITVNAGSDVIFQGGPGRYYDQVDAPFVAAAAIAGGNAAGNKLPTPTAYLQPGSLVITLSDPVQSSYEEIHDDGKGRLLDKDGNQVGTINYNTAEVIFSSAVANTGSTAQTSYRYGNYSYAYAQIGHGGRDAVGAVVFDEAGKVLAAGHQGDIQVAAGTEGTGRVDFAGGRSNNAWAMIGHGGSASNGDHVGDIKVDASGAIRFAGTEYIRTFAQIGHGGYDSDLTGTTTQGGFSYNSDAIGNMGDILINSRGLSSTNGNIRFLAGGGQQAWVQMGHGGYGTKGASSGNTSTDGAGNALGQNAISVQTEGDMIFQAGDASGYGDQSGVQMGNGRFAYAQLGHGGYDADANNGTGVDGEGYNADIIVKAGGLVRFQAATIVNDPSGGVNGPLYTQTNNYVQLGHGGYGSNGDHRGDIRVDAGTGVFFRSGGVETGATANLDQRTYAQLGHGGYASPGYGGNDTAGQNGDISVLSRSGDVIFRGSNANNGYVMLGHGGRSAHEGSSGQVLVAALEGNIEFTAGTGTGQFAQLGHGGYDAQAQDRAGDIIARAAGQISVTTKSATGAYAMVGHGGYNGDSNAGGNIIVSAGSGALSTHLGTGLFDDLGDYDGDGSGDALQFGSAPLLGGDIQNGIILQGGRGTETFAMIGHGGRSAGNAMGTNRSTLNGKIGVESVGDIVVEGGTATRSFAQIGHGGYEDNTVDFTLSGDISVISREGKLKMTAGSGSEAWASLGHGALRTSATSSPKGTRDGAIYIEADNWVLSRTGTALTGIGHRSLLPNNGIVNASNFTVVGTGAAGSTDHLIDQVFASAQDHLAAGGDATFVGVNLTMDVPLNYRSVGSTSMIAMGDLEVKSRVQNGGSGDVSLIAGWDGIYPDLDFLDKVPMRDFDVPAIIADSNAWGNNGGSVIIGGGNQTTGVAVGSAGGTTTALGDAINLIGGMTVPNAFAQIGFQPIPGVSPTGDIHVHALSGGVSIDGGDAGNTYAQIGHRNNGLITQSMSGEITVTSEAGITMSGGNGINASSQIGHGGVGATSDTISGDVIVNAADNLLMTGGSSGAASVQIGHGGYATNAAMSGNVMVDTGGKIDITVIDGSKEAYAKIGHGDDLRYGSLSMSGTGTRDGDIQVTAGDDIAVKGGMVGHVNPQSPAVNVGGNTWIAPARSNPVDPSAGNLIGDANSVFAGGNQVRFYLPRRENNQVAAGAKINGVSYDGGVSDPWYVQRPDEYTNYIVNDSGTFQIGEHDNTLGSGPAPVVTGNYAFYFDTIVIGGSGPLVPPKPPVPIQPTQPVIPLPSEPKAMTSSEFFVDDRAYEEWLRAQEAIYRRPGTTNIYYEGYRQYGPNGESVYQYGFSDAPGLSTDEEDVLRRHLRHLRETTNEGEEAPANQSPGGEE